MKFIRVSILFISSLFSIVCAYGQTSPISLQNIEKVKVDEISDTQLAEFWEQAKAKGVGIDQLVQLAVKRNMDPDEVNKLRARIESLPVSKSATEAFGKDNQTDRRTLGSQANAKLMLDGELRRIFGAELFTNANLTFEPNLKMATPEGYQIGPDDELLIDVSGFSEVSYNLIVTPEGRIRIPIVGPVMVNGLTIEQARRKIVAQMANHYNGVLTGETNVSVTLGNIRSIKVILLGEVNRPGTYTLPSLATVFNALYASGGPNKNGSFRNIKVIRNNKTIATVDIYEFLLKGVAKGNIQLKDQDVIRISSYENRVEITGSVKRDGFYEVAKGETLKDVIDFAGGFRDNAYRDRIKVYRNSGKEKSVADVTKDLYSMFIPQTGDQFVVDEILNRFSNRVRISGAVFRPGTFSLDEGLTLAKLIKKAEGVREDAFMSRGLIYRLKEDNSVEALAFDLNEVLKGKDVVLKREDQIQILSKLELKEAYSVSIAGEVLSPGTFPYADNLRVEDLIVAAGGLRESADRSKIEIARRIKTVDVGNPSAQVSTIVTYEVSEDLKTKDGKEIILLPFDVVSVYRLPGFQAQRNVSIEGEVFHPGQFTLIRNNERISEVISRAGGLTGSAYADGAILVRTRKMSALDNFIRKRKIASVLKQSTDTTNANDAVMADIREDVSIVGINLQKILKNPGSKHDLVMEENDVIRIPRAMQTIKISGEVLYPVRIQFERGKRFNEYVRGAGGYTERALRRKAYIIYPNGSAASTRKILFVFNKHPKIKPGSEIIVPVKEERRGLSALEAASVTSSFATLLVLIYTITR